MQNTKNIHEASTSSSKSAPKRRNWTLSELKHFIAVALHHDLFDIKDPKPGRLTVKWQSVTYVMKKLSFERTAMQMYNKLISLKKDCELLNSSENLEEVPDTKNYYSFLHDVVVLKKTNAITQRVSELIPRDTSNDPIINEPMLKRNTWTYDEINDLLTLCLENHLFEFKDSNIVKNSLIYNKISNDMKKANYVRDSSSIINKIGKLRTEFTVIKRYLHVAEKRVLKGLLRARFITKKCWNYFRGDRKTLSLIKSIP